MEDINSWELSLQNYIELLKENDYNCATIKSYQQYVSRFLKYFEKHTPDKISDNEIRNYIFYLVSQKQYSSSAQNQAINAIKLYYRKIFKREIDDRYLPRPRKEKSLPQTLNEKEVAAILKSITNLRSKCIISLIYSAGLTPSEVSYIRITDLDSKKMQILITKPKQNRYTVLSNKLLLLLREYFKQYKPNFWLFENSMGRQFSKRTMQKIFQNAVVKSKIRKRATLTILRNSFAVHLLEKGVDIRYIQELFGHKSVRTTSKYLKVSKKDINVIKSPLDYLNI